jgi:acetyl-CoA carboxylase carboxyltransferase component
MKNKQPFYAASRLWIDAIIDPWKTQSISMAIEAANHARLRRCLMWVC